MVILVCLSLHDRIRIQGIVEDLLAELRADSEVFSDFVQVNYLLLFFSLPGGEELLRLLDHVS